jgi:glycosyltransferase involved in cell wall biosynthesis
MSRRILLNGSFAPSITNFRGHLIQDMQAAGHTVHISVPDVSAEQRRKIEAIGAVLHEVPLDRAGINPLRDWAYYRRLRALIRRVRPHLVIGYTIKPVIWGSFAAGAEGVASASMITGLGYTFVQRRTLMQRLLGFASRWLYRRATAGNRVVVFQNQDDRADFIAAGCLADEAKAKLVNGSGVDVQHFAPRPLPTAPVFLMIARLLVSKGVREYAAAAQQIRAQWPDCRFLLVGNLDETPDRIGSEELQAWQEAGIECWGWTDDVREPISQASIFVLPSYREGTPRTVLEAAAMGRPVITTDAPGCRETVRDGETGLLVPARDVAALVTAMERLASDHSLRAEMGRRARDYVIGKFAIEQVNRTLMNHLGLLTEGTG